MTLARKMLLQSAAVLAGLLLLSAASLWGIFATTQDLGVALRGYEQLRRVYDVGSHVAMARGLLSADRPEPNRAAAELQIALSRLKLTEGIEASELDRQADDVLRPPLRQFLAALNQARSGHTTDADYSSLAASLDAITGRASHLAGQIRKTIQEREAAAVTKRKTTVILMACLAAAILLAAVAIGVHQYRSVMRPLHRLGHGVRTIATGTFDQRIDEHGSDEFVALAADFNRMADELRGFYRQLEEKVAQKSHELVRSERLASVGYLAAGLAHEINNPLGIIAGHAELILRQADQLPANAAGEELRSSLAVICEEAFRCKDIIQKLLGIARPGAESRAVVSLADLARGVISMLSGLGQYRGRQLQLTHDPPQRCRVVASEGEMKQVLLNLAMNALEAVGHGGVVRVEVRHHAESVVLSVSDNGRGMSRETLGRIFEPFFTEKPGPRQPGTGLGLSITHAIVQGHGGRIVAHSDGPGTGSRFTITLPAASPSSSG